MSGLRITGVIIALAALSGTGGWAVGGGIATTTPPSSTTTGPAGPVITQFNCAPGDDNIWTFYGQVANPTGVPGLMIEFDGLPSVSSKSVAVNPDGSFSLTVMLQPNETGIVGAILTDDTATEYDEAEALVT